MTAAIAGIIGVAVGIVAERLVRNIGGIWCEPQGEWEPQFFKTGSRDFYGDPVAEPETPEGQPNHASYSFTLDLFNSKEHSAFRFLYL